MKFDLDTSIIDFDGNEIPLSSSIPSTAQNSSSMKLSDVIVMALTADIRNEQIDGSKKFYRYTLAVRAKKGGIQDFKVEDVTLIKKLIGDVFAPMIVGRAYDIIEPPIAEG